MGVLDGVVGDYVASLEFRSQGQAFPVVGAVGGQTVLEGRADVQFAVGAAELDEALPVDVVTLESGPETPDWYE